MVIADYSDLGDVQPGIVPLGDLQYGARAKPRYMQNPTTEASTKATYLQSHPVYSYARVLLGVVYV